MQKILSNKKAIALFMLPTMLLIGVLVIVPIGMSVYYSLLDWDGIGKSIFVGLRNYKDLISDERFLNSVKNSLLYACCSLCIQLPFSLLLAIVVANVKKGEKFYRTTFFIPVIISSVVIGQLWQKIYNGDYGLLNSLLSMIGIQGQDWIGQESTALVSAFIPNLWQYIGYHMLIMYAGIKSISPDINEAARIDGANRFHCMTNITLPSIAPTIIMLLILKVGKVMSVGFEKIILLYNPQTYEVADVLSSYIYRYGLGGSFDYGYTTAIGMFSSVINFILVISANKISKKLTETGIW